MPASVLIVDDDARFRSLAARMLKAEGLTVVGEAGDVGEGRAAAHALRPDAALVDVKLPDGDGIALAGELAGLPWSPRVLVVSSEVGVANADRPGPNGTQLPFVAKEDLPSARLHDLLGGD
jgi:DNA-binding NarL/FixJ family response regulator